ncbi:MAG: SBBP repeat-containing protein [Deltaproteobacteria bacterium]|nr:SBBP repeat-containing protein [Deltaproteobacteria bacterium]
MSGLNAFVLIVLIFASPALCFAQDAPVVWIKTFTGGDEIVDLSVDLAGNIYVTGTTKKSPPDYLTLKYNTNGKKLWKKSYGIAGKEDVPSALKVDNKGNVYVTGKSHGGASAYDFLTLKYTPTGELKWSARLNNTENHTDYALNLAVDRFENVYVTGGSRSSKTGYDIVVVKYGSAGNREWISVFTGPGFIPPWIDDFGRYIQVDEAGNVYVAGTIEKSHTDIFVMKLNRDGLLLWSQIYDGPSHFHDDPSGLALDSEGNIFVAGNISSVSNQNIILIKYSNSGVRQWVKSYSKPSAAYDFFLDNSGNVYIAGSAKVSGSSNFITMKFASNGAKKWYRFFNDGGPFAWAKSIDVDDAGNVYVTGNVMTKTYSDNVITLKYNSLGKRVWMARHSGHTDNARAVAVDSLGGVIVATDDSRGDWTIIKYAQEP